MIPERHELLGPPPSKTRPKSLFVGGVSDAVGDISDADVAQIRTVAGQVDRTHRLFVQSRPQTFFLADLLLRAP